MTELGILLAFLLIFAWTSYGSPEARWRRALGLRRKVRIVDAEEGVLVTIMGQVRMDQAPLLAPFSQVPCCYYAVKVEQILGEDTETPVNESRSCDIFVEDDTGQAFIELSKAQDITILSPPRTHRSYPDGGSDVDPDAAAFFDSRRVFHSGGSFTRLSESTIVNGDTIAVIGQGSWKVESRETDPQSPRGRCLVFRSPPTIFVTNDPALLKEARLVGQIVGARCPACGAEISLRIVDFKAKQARCAKCATVISFPVGE